MKLSFLLGILLISTHLVAQVSGNVNYQNQVRYSDTNINVNFPGGDDFTISVKGLANVRADSYVAIFSAVQVGKTTEEVHRLLDTRIERATNELSSRKDLSTFVDMISFVPVYEYTVEKKVFSKTTYNEIPVGFELRKNIHFQYTDPNALNDILARLADVEIYDLVRVDYFSDDLATVKKELMNEARGVLQEKLAGYAELLNSDLDSLERQLIDGYRVVLPVEMYKSYNAYSSSSLDLKKSANVNSASPSTTLYYQPIIDKEFDFVLNPVVLEPVIQVMYEVKLKVKREREKVPTAVKEYLLVTPNGDVKKLNLE